MGRAGAGDGVCRVPWDRGPQRAVRFPSPCSKRTWPARSARRMPGHAAARVVHPVFGLSADVAGPDIQNAERRPPGSPRSRDRSSGRPWTLDRPKAPRRSSSHCLSGGRVPQRRHLPCRPGVPGSRAVAAAAASAASDAEWTGDQARDAAGARRRRVTPKPTAMAARAAEAKVPGSGTLLKTFETLISCIAKS